MEPPDAAGVLVAVAVAAGRRAVKAEPEGAGAAGGGAQGVAPELRGEEAGRPGAAAVEGAEEAGADAGSGCRGAGTGAVDGRGAAGRGPVGTGAEAGAALPMPLP